MKKFKTLLFSSVPLWLAIGVQILVSYYMLIIATGFIYANDPSLTLDVNASTDALMALMTNVHFLALISIVFSVCCIFLFGMWYYSRCGGEFRISLKKDVHPLEIAGIVCLIPGTQFLTSIVTAMISVIFPSWMEAYQELIESAGMTGDIPLMMLLYSVLLAPVSEELIFRGVIFKIAKRAFPFWIANIIQAFFFGAFHQNMLQGCYTFILGLFLGYICEKGSIYHVIFFHLLFNMWGTLAADLFANINPALYTSLVFIGAGMGTVGGLKLFREGVAQKHSA